MWSSLGVRAVAVTALLLGGAQAQWTPFFNCSLPPNAGSAYCDTSHDFQTRAAALVSTLSTEEKAGLFMNHQLNITRLHQTLYNWWNEGLHGVKGARGVTTTSFPNIITTASSYNTSLFKMLGDMVSTEVRGLANPNPDSKPWAEACMRRAAECPQGLTIWTPNINIFRDPRWGRGQETPGEDPTLNSKYAINYVQGMQGDDEKYLKTSACLKHFAAYSEEGSSKVAPSPDAPRSEFSAVVTAQDMEDTYLPAFESGVVEGKASGIMCSYNSETYGTGLFGPGTAAADDAQGGQHKGVPSCANSYLLTDLARKKWGFDGYITADCGAVGDVQHAHKYTNHTNQTVKAVLSAGMDIDCGWPMNDVLTKANLLPLLEDGELDPKLIDTALIRLYSVQMRLGMLDHPTDVPWANYTNAENVNTPAHQALARQAAEQGLVLLKNEHNSLPLKQGSRLKIAVVGPYASATTELLGN